MDLWLNLRLCRVDPEQPEIIIADLIANELRMVEKVRCAAARSNIHDLIRLIHIFLLHRLLFWKKRISPYVQNYEEGSKNLRR